MRINDENKLITVAPEVRQGVTYIPVEKLAKLMGLDVTYDTKYMGLSIIIPRDRSKLVEQAGELVIEIKESYTNQAISMKKKPEVIVEKGDLKLGEVIFDPKEPTKIRIPVLQSSDEPVQVIIKGIYVDVDHTVPEGKWYIGVGVGGDALADQETLLEMEVITPMVC